MRSVLPGAVMAVSDLEQEWLILTAKYCRKNFFFAENSQDIGVGF